MPQLVCAERSRLSRKVAEAVTTFYALREQQREARARKDVPALVLELDKARGDQRKAQIALREHIREHRCVEGIS